MSSVPQCSRLVPIISARVPILKFIHRPTGIHCDISFKNRMSVQNTAFIRHCTEVDSRVRPLMLAVRYFAKHYSLAGGGGGMKMSSYALTMIIITFTNPASVQIMLTYSLARVQNIVTKCAEEILVFILCAYLALCCSSSI